MTNPINTALSILLLFTSISLFAQDNESNVDFASDIKPILESQCIRCHGPDDDQGGCVLHLSDEAMNYIEPGDSENSAIYEYITSDEEDEMMPPSDEGGPLDDSDIKLIKTWIDQGANWPDGLELIAFDPDKDDTDQIGESSGENGGAQDGGNTDEDAPNIYRAIGVLHPAALHLPMGLLLASGFFALLSLRGNFVMSDCAYYCLWLGTFGAIAACVTGWWFVLEEMPKEFVETSKLIAGLQNTDHKVFWHRTSALAATAFALLLALFAASARNRDPDDGVGWKLGAIVLALGIGFVGHQGGKLSWGEHHYDELYEVIDQYAPGWIDTDKVDEVANDNAEDTSVEKVDTDETDVETIP